MPKRIRKEPREPDLSAHQILEEVIGDPLSNVMDHAVLVEEETPPPNAAASKKKSVDSAKRGRSRNRKHP